MHPSTATILVLPAVGLILAGLLPSRWANRGVVWFRQLVIALAALQCMIALGLGLSMLWGHRGVYDVVLFRVSPELPLEAGVYFDGIAALMLTLVSFVGWVICRFSLRYLDGQATQGRYFRWTAFTLGAVSGMVIAGNLLMFFVAWVMTSLGLHQLLLHYAHRPAARRAAWTKFNISRLGDILLIVALALAYAEFGTFDFAELFTAMETWRTNPLPASTSVAWIGWLLMMGAVTKSAQLPFHTWLPQTMETPTPVSALMHAGIVNAGGYLVIRTSPLISQAPGALPALAVIGGATACFAAIVMLTQNSVKRSLAYSTIAQMGFMMLQCGLGAFSAAMLHIVAHSLYKAHAFLSSGSVVAQRSATQRIELEAGNLPAGWRHLGLAGAITLVCYAIAMLSLGLSPADKPGGFLLGFILCLAFTAWLAETFRSASWRVRTAAVVITGVLAFAYGCSFLVVDQMVRSNPAIADPSISTGGIAAVIGIGFGLLFMLQRLLLSSKAPSWLPALYVHASNGFYVDALIRRMVGGLASS